MQIQSKTERNFWTRTALAVVPDAIIGAIIGYVISANVIASVILTVLALQVLYIALLLKDAAWGWLLFRVSGDRTTLKSAAFDFLRNNKFPEPDDYISDPANYFQNVMRNSQLPCDQRIKAAIELTSAQCLVQFRGKLRVIMAWEDAIEKYKKTFPPKQWADER